MASGIAANLSGTVIKYQGAVHTGTALTGLLVYRFDLHIFPPGDTTRARWATVATQGQLGQMHSRSQAGRATRN